MNLKPYSNSGRGEAAAYKNVPIAYREEVLAYYRKKNIKIRLRYRGQRSQASRTSRQATCLLRDANRFSVYFANYF